MTGIFLSYSRKDSTVAQKLMTEFGSIELDVWVDWEDIPPAVGWLDQILRGIEAADAFVFLLSPDSIQSEVCNVELEHAHKNAKRIIPIVVRDVDPKQVVSILRDLNWIFIREQDDFAPALEKIKRAINLDIDWLHEHRRLQVRALDWDRRKNPSLLLHGSDLRDAVKMVAEHETSDPKPSDLQKIYISFSRRNERVRTLTWVSAGLALLVMVLLSILALDQRQIALENAIIAEDQKVLAQKSESLAIENARAALVAKAAADKNAKIAQAQRSAARAQIFQARTGGLFTSTLLAIDSYQRNPSNEAEGILRKNISLLPIPVVEFQQTGKIMAIEVSPDGESFVYTAEDGSACLVRFEGGERLFCGTSSGSVLDATFSPDGTLLVTSASTGEVRILNVEDGQLLKELNFGVAVRDVNINPDGDLLAIARDDGRITLIRIPNYVLFGELSVFGSLRVTAFSPDGDWFAAASNIGSITFWNLASKKIVSSVTHRGEVFDIAFSADSRKLISGGADNFAITTSPSTGRELLRVTNEDWVVDVEYSPDNAWFVTVSNDFRVRVWDTNSGEERLRLLQDSLVNEVTISPNGLWIAATGADRTVRVWSAANGAEMFQIPLDNAGTELDFSADSAYLVTGDIDGHVSIWDISVLDTNAGYLRFDEFIENIEMSPNGDWFAASTAGQVWLLDPELYATQTAPLGSPSFDFKLDAVYDMTINPQGTQLAISTEEGRVILVNRAGGGNSRNIVEVGPAKRIAFSADGETLFLAGADGSIQSRSLTSSDAGILWQAESAVYAVSASSTNLLAIGMDEKIIVLDLASNTVLVELAAPGKNQLIQFSPNGSALASSTLSGRTFIWHLEESQFKLEAEFVGNQAYSLSFDPEGERLFLGETDEVLIFDALTGEEINRIRQKGAVTALAFSPDNSTLLTGSLRTIQFFDLNSIKYISGEDIITSACTRLTRNLSLSEWVFFFEDEEYRDLCEFPSEP